MKVKRWNSTLAATEKHELGVSKLEKPKFAHQVVNGNKK
jgi:hypothetical protein